MSVHSFDTTREIILQSGILVPPVYSLLRDDINLPCYDVMWLHQGNIARGTVIRFQECATTDSRLQYVNHNRVDRPILVTQEPFSGFTNVKLGRFFALIYKGEPFPNNIFFFGWRDTSKDSKDALHLCHVNWCCTLVETFFEVEIAVANSSIISSGLPISHHKLY